MHPIIELRRQVGLTQAALAAAAGTSQPAVAAYESGAKSPTLRTLDRLAGSVGLEMDIAFVTPLTREDRRSIALHRAIADRLVTEPAATIRQARRNLRHMAALHPDAATLLDEWRVALSLSIDALVDLLVDPRPHARDLRQVTPFAGVLAPSERWSVYRQPRSWSRV